MFFGGRVGDGLWIHWLFSIAMLVLIIVVVLIAIRWLLRGERDRGSGPPPAPRPDDPLEILRQRYARGEIDEEEYERRRKTLSGG